MIGLVNFDHNFMNEFHDGIGEFNLLRPHEKIPDLDGYLINLIPKTSPDLVFLKFQIAVIEKAKQDKKKLLIFDGSLSLTEKEMKWLRGNTIFFEPALHHNDKAIYLPHHLTFPELTFNLDERFYDIGFFGEGSLETEAADRLFFYSARNLPFKFVTSKEFVTTKDIEKKCKDNNVEILDKEEPVNMVMFLPTKSQINSGYMFNCQRWLIQKTPILFPSDMVYYRFTPQVSTKDDVNYWYKKKLRDALLQQFKTEVELFYPKMLLKNVIKKIKEYV